MALPGYCSRRRSASVVKISSRTSCKFCFLFLHLTDTVGGDANPDEHLELRAFPFSLSWRIYAHAFAQHQVAKGHLPDACLFAYQKAPPPTNYDVRKALESCIATIRLAVLTSSPVSPWHHRGCRNFR